MTWKQLHRVEKISKETIPASLAQFHHLIIMLLDQPGLVLPPSAPDQDLYSLEVDGHYEVHLGLMDEESWFAIAVLPDPIPTHAPLAEWLQWNVVGLQSPQPVIALDDECCPCCFLRLPLQEDVTILRQALEGLFHMADQLCEHLE